MRQAKDSEIIRLSMGIREGKYIPEHDGEQVKVIKPQDLYSMFKTDEAVQEPAKQFYRRLNNIYYQIDDNGEIKAIDIDTDMYKGYTLGNINTVFKELNINVDKPLENSLLKKFFIPDPVFEDDTFSKNDTFSKDDTSSKIEYKVKDFEF